MKLRSGKIIHSRRPYSVIGIDPLFWRCYYYKWMSIAIQRSPELKCVPSHPHFFCYNNFVHLYLSPRSLKNGEIHINGDRYEETDIFLHPKYYNNIQDQFIQRMYDVDMLLNAKRFLDCGQRRRFYANRF